MRCRVHLPSPSVRIRISPSHCEPGQWLRAKRTDHLEIQTAREIN
jgi:hypothetical protein